MSNETPMDEQELLNRLQELADQVNSWVKSSEDRLGGLEAEVKKLASSIEAQANEATEKHNMVGMWTRQMYGRVVQVEGMLKSLAMNLAQGRVPVRMPPRVGHSAPAAAQDDKGAGQ